jgi:hypothetical protein
VAIALPTVPSAYAASPRANVVRGLGVYYWTRYRWSFGSVVVEIFLLAVLALVLRQLGVQMDISDASARMHGFRNANAVHEMVELCAVVVTIILLAPLLVTNREPNPCAYVLPMASRTLALCCLSITAVAMALGWFGFAVLVWRPIGLPMPVIWPGTLAAATATLSQAIRWIPARPGAWQFVPIALIPLAVLGGGIEAIVLGVGPNIVAAEAVWATGVAGLTGVWSLRRARCSDIVFERRQRADSASRDARPIVVRQPFRSALQAAAWLGWRTGGPGMAGALTPLLFFMLAQSAAKALIRTPDAFPWEPLMKSGIWTWPGVTALLVYLQMAGPFAARIVAVLPLMRRNIAAPEAVLARSAALARGLDLFRYVRPLTCATLAASRFRLAAIGVIQSAALCVLVALVCFFSPAMDAGGHRALLGTLLFRLFSADASLLVRIAVLVAVLAIATWSGQAVVVTMDPDRLGLHNFGLWALEFIFFFAAYVMVLVRTSVSPDQVMTGAVFGTVLHVTFALKMAAAALLAYRARRGGLLSSSTIAAIGDCWLLTIGALTIALRQVLPANAWPTDQIVCALALFVPLARIYAAPLLIAQDRHR